MRSEPGTIVAARQDSPLIIGVGQGETIIASDIPVVLEYTRDVLVLEDGDVAVVTRQGRVGVRGPTARCASRSTCTSSGTSPRQRKGGYETFMLKEIYEQPTAIRETLRGRMGR